MSTWKLDPVHTSAGFSVRHMMISTVRSQFKNVNGTLEFDPENPQVASVEAIIDVKEMASTGVEDRDNHLLSPDFLDADNYPQITFKSTSVEIVGENEGKVIGNLTIHDVTKEVTLNVEYLGQTQNPYGMTVAGFIGTTKINREDFGLTWNMALEAGGVMVGKDIKIELDVEAILQTETEKA